MLGWVRMKLCKKCQANYDAALMAGVNTYIVCKDCLRFEYPDKPKTLEQECPECKEWSLQSEWIETEVPCEDCGSHAAIKCPKCDEDIDTVYFDVRERESEIPNPRHS